MNEMERQLAELLVARDRARPRDMGPLCKQIAETEAALAAERAAEAQRRSCGRCGHVEHGCSRCGESTMLGGTIAGQRYCHTQSEQPSCYTLILREKTAQMLADPGARYRAALILDHQE